MNLHNEVMPLFSDLFNGQCALAKYRPLSTREPKRADNNNLPTSFRFPWRTFRHWIPACQFGDSEALRRNLFARGFNPINIPDAGAKQKLWRQQVAVALVQ